VTNEAKVFATAAQTYLEQVQNNNNELSNSLLSVSSSLTTDNAELFSREARQSLENSISAINGQIGGRKVFSGTATGTLPLNDVDTLMTAIVAEVSGEPTASDMIQAVKDWFDDPAGFDTVMYQGSTTSLSPLKVGPDEQVSLTLRADNDDLKHSLQSLVIGSLATEPGLALSDTDKVLLMQSTTPELVESNNRLVDLRSDIGFVQARIEDSAARNEAAKTSLGLAKNELVQADPYETFAKLEEARTQLETLYTVTARSSQLSLLRFIT
jgi:flagellar hook-associated protein 3 FlgL